MKRIVIAAIFILSFCLPSFTQKANFLLVNSHFLQLDEIVVFDDFGKVSLNDQKARLANLFNTLANDKTLISFIEFRLNRNESRKKKTKRFNEISKHLDHSKVNKSRITLLFIEDEKENTRIWVQPQNTEFVPILIVEKMPYKLIKADKLKEKISELLPKE